MAFGFLSKIFSRDRPQDMGPTAGSSYRFLTGKSNSGKWVTEHSAMQISAVYACVKILAEAIAGLPLHLYEMQGQHKDKAFSHSLYRMLHDEPNEEMTSFVFRETLMTHLLLWGNAYAYIWRDRGGKVLGLYILMPDRMRVGRDDAGNICYEYQMYQDDGSGLKQGTVTLTPYDVLHIPGLGFDGLVGYSPIAMARNAIGLTMAAEEFGSKFFANGATPSGVLEHPNNIKNKERLRNEWHEGFSGNRAFKVAVLEEGVKYTPISVKPDEAQFLETRKFQLDEIARIFRVPPHMIGDLERSTFSNIENMSREFVTYTLNPWIARWEQGLNRALLNTSEKQRYFFRFNVDGLLRGDIKSRFDSYATAIQNGFMCPNDIRALEDLDRVPEDQDGDQFMVNGNMIPLKDVGAAYLRGAGTDPDMEPDTDGEESEDE